jgi:hypothetical protein
MPRFRNAPSRRRQPAPTAKWLVLGLTEARLVALGQRTTHLLPVKPSHHRKRFLSGQRLAVKAYVGGPTECHVVVTDAQRVQLGHVDYAAVRELGYPYLDAFRVAWVDEHETTWRAGETVAEVDLLERFDRRHAHKEVWLVRFALDRTEVPRMLAQAGRDQGSYVAGPDRRWRYQPGTEDAETDRGYTSSDSLALRDAGRALKDDEWEQHIGRPARVRETQRQAMIHADRITQTTSERLTAARAAAQAKGFDMRDEFRRYDRLVLRERHGDALEQLALIESRVYPRRAAA